jgi:hypothetical protein
MESSFYEGPLKFLPDEKWIVCDEPDEEDGLEVDAEFPDVSPDLPYAIQHPSRYLKQSIISSSPFIFSQTWGRKLNELTLAYEGMNRALENGLRTGRAGFGELQAVLSPREKKAVHNWVQRKKTGPIPLRVTITGRRQGNLLVTEEYGPLPMADMAEVPEGLDQGYIYRFTTARGQIFFRLGWRRQNLASRGRDKSKTRRAKSEHGLSQVRDNLEDSTNENTL